MARTLIKTIQKTLVEEYYGKKQSVADTTYVNFALEESTLSQLIQKDAGSHLQFTVLQDCFVEGVFSCYRIGAVSDGQQRVEINGDQVYYTTRITSVNAGQAVFYAKLKAGDTIAPSFVAGTLDTSRGSFSLRATKIG